MEYDNIRAVINGEGMEPSTSVGSCSEALRRMRAIVTRLSDEYEAVESIDLGKRLLAARNELQAALAELTEPAQDSTAWGAGCSMCAYTGEEFNVGVSSGDGWTGKPCPHCVNDEPAPNCSECGQMIDGWAHPDGFGNYHCDKCCPTCDHIQSDSRWCECACADQVDYGTCPVCGGEVLPF